MASGTTLRRASRCRTAWWNHSTLATDLKALWSEPSTEAWLKKRIVRTVIHEVVADIDAEAAEIVLLIHWMGRVRDAASISQ